VNVRRPARSQAYRAAALCLLTLVSACGKKGPPLPPLVLVPVEPPELTAVRRGDEVQLDFKIPDANTDRSTPADLSRVEVFALTSSGDVSVDDVIRRGARVGTFAVNKPKDPDEPEPAPKTVKAPATAARAAVPAPTGLNQGDHATFTEPVSASDNESARRNYVLQGMNERGRRGTPSPRVAVPLVPLPPVPEQPSVDYDEKAITVSWTAVDDAPSGAHTYSVYRPGQATAVTTTPLAEVQFKDTSFTWDQERCYEVRAGLTLENVRVEGPASPARCVTPHDRFPPAKPDGLISVASEAAISLIWSANHEADLAGYVVLRAIAPETTLTPVTETPITDTNFKDTVPSGATVTYAVVAIDKMGNRSEPSNTTNETAR